MAVAYFRNIERPATSYSQPPQGDFPAIPLWHLGTGHCVELRQAWPGPWAPRSPHLACWLFCRWGRLWSRTILVSPSLSESRVQRPFPEPLLTNTSCFPGEPRAVRALRVCPRRSPNLLCLPQRPHRPMRGHWVQPQSQTSPARIACSLSLASLCRPALSLA